MTTLNDDQASKLLDSLAWPVAAEPIRLYTRNVQYESSFTKAMEALESSDFDKACHLFAEAHRILQIPDGNSSGALRNSALAMFHAGKAHDSFELMLPWFQRNTLYGSPLWNFAIIAIRDGKLDCAIQALEQWKSRPLDYLLSKCHLLGAAICFRMDRIVDAQRWLAKAIELDYDYVESRLSRVGIQLTRKESQVVVDSKTRDLLERRLVRLLEPKKPERYAVFTNLPISDFQSVSRAIDYAADDDFLNALATLDGVSDNRTSQFAKWCLEATIRLQCGEVDKAEEIVQRLQRAGTQPWPGSAWWNWAAIASQQGNFKESATRLRRCVQTEYYTKGEAWVALLIASILVGDEDTAKRAAFQAWNHSQRSKGLVADALRDLDQSFLRNIGVTLESADVPTATIRKRIDPKRLRQALDGSDASAISEALAIGAATRIEDLPEYESATLEAKISTIVPILIIRSNQQKAFKDGVRALLSQDASEAVRIFRELAEQFPYTRGLKVNLAAALFRAGNYVESLEVSRKLYQSSSTEHRKSDAIAVFACLVAEKRFREAEEFLADAKDEIGGSRYLLYKAVLADLQGRARDAAECLFDLASSKKDASEQLLGLCTLRCADARDTGRIKQLAELALARKPGGSKAEKQHGFDLTPRECRNYEKMLRTFEHFGSSRDWGSASDFFGAVEELCERQFYNDDEPRNLLLLLNSKVFLGRVLIKSGKQLEGDEALQSALETMSVHRERLTPQSEGKIALDMALTYEEMNAHFRRMDCLEVAKRAIPTDVAVVGALKTGLPSESDVELLGYATADIRKELSLFVEHKKQEQASRAMASLTELLKVIDREDLAPGAKAFMDLLEVAWCKEEFVDSNKTRAALNGLDMIALACRLRLPRKEAELALEMLSQLEESLVKLSEESSSKICDVIEVEANHDGTNASLLLECRSHCAKELGPVSINVGSTKLLEPVGDQRDQFVIDNLKPGQREYICLKFGIRQEWPAEKRVGIPVKWEAPDGKNKRSYSESLAPVFKLFDDKIQVNYDAKPIDPSAVDGQPLYGRQDIVSRLAMSLIAPRQSRLYFLFGPRKVGKTSVLTFVVDEIRKQAPQYLCALVNLDQTWTDGSPVKHIGKQLLRVGRRFHGLKTDSLANIPSSMEEFIDWLEDLREASGTEHVVILLDEFWKLLEYLRQQSDGASFLGDLRQLWSGAHGVSLLLADWHRKEQLSAWVPAQFWADIDVIRIGFLDGPASKKALRGPTSNTPVRFLDEAAEQVFFLTQGYPWHLQELCYLSFREALESLRHVITKEDVETASLKLLEQDRTFTEGLFKPEEISPIEEILLWKLCRYTESDFQSVPVSILETGEPTLGADEVSTCLKLLSLKSILKDDDGSQVRMCSPLVVYWLHKQFSKGVRISKEPFARNLSLPQLEGVVLESESEQQIAKLVDTVFEQKESIQDLARLKALASPYQHLQYRSEEKIMRKPVTDASAWDSFVGSMKQAFVEDAPGKTELLRTGPFRIIEPILQQIRLRRNYCEHPDTATPAAKKVELRQRQLDIGKLEPVSIEDWTRLQVGLLQRLSRAMESQVASLAAVEQIEPDAVRV